MKLHEPIALTAAAVVAFPLSQIWAVDVLFWIDRGVLGVLGQSDSLLLWCLVLASLAGGCVALVLVRTRNYQGRFILAFAVLALVGILVVGRREDWGVYDGSIDPLSMVNVVSYTASWLCTFSVVALALHRTLSWRAQQRAAGDVRNARA